MTIDFESLSKISIKTWKVKQCIVLEWYDAPIEGFCELTIPEVAFYFKTFAFSKSTRSIDHYLYKIKFFPTLDTLNSLREILEDLEEPRHPVWIPKWDFTSNEKQILAENKVSLLIESCKESPEFLIQSDDMIRFKSIWKIL